MPRRETVTRLPVWAMGLANMPTGFVYGFISTAFGILLAARGVSLAQIAGISATAFSPTWWAWTLCPILDVRFTKRAYAFTFAALAALLLAAAVFSLGNLLVFTILLTAACTSITLFQNAVTGWSPDALDAAQYDTISGWLNVANLGAAGVFSIIAVTLVRNLPLSLAAPLLGLLVFAPTALLLCFPAPPQPAGTLRATFAAARRDTRRVLRAGRIWIALAIFLAPASCFALTNLFSSLGADFHTSERATTALNGPGVALVCSLGCLLAIPLCRIMRRADVYLLAGLIGAAFAIALALAPATPLAYAICLLGYNLFQGFNYTSFTALVLETTGPNNALAGTMVAILYASVNVPITAMTALDGQAYRARGLHAMLLTDAAASITFFLLLKLLILPFLERQTERRRQQ